MVTPSIESRDTGQAHFSGQESYIPDVAREQGPVDFKITSYVQGFVAANHAHDFTKLIGQACMKKRPGTSESSHRR